MKVAFLSVNLKKFDLPLIFNHWFTFSSDPLWYETSSSSKGSLKVDISNIKRYDKEGLINSAISSRNEIEKRISSNKMLRDIPSFELKSLLAKHFLETYNAH